MGDNTAAIFLIAILLLAGGLLTLIGLTRKSGRILDVEKYQSRWLAIESSLKKDEPSSFSMSVLDADKLVDAALKESGYKGDTMGARMKDANSRWSNADHVWAAHKIRNRIAHEADANVSYEIAARSLIAYKKALKDLGAI